MLLYASFEGQSNLEISKDDLARMWSLEMQWFSPEDASKIAQLLHESGWLVGSGNALSPCRGSLREVPELGWQPFLKGSGIPLAPIVDEEQKVLNPVPESPKTEDPGNTLDSDDALGKLLIDVSSMSGLERREVVRRAKRKRLALGPVSLSMAVLLLAREQNLEMDGLVELIEN
tara:strand:- start:119 stop:640 length:522 start_codon:yes stop_codon:yes gene_type:complete